MCRTEIARRLHASKHTSAYVTSRTYVWIYIVYVLQTRTGVRKTREHVDESREAYNSTYERKRHINRNE